MPFLALLFRWMHILAAMAAVGGPMFLSWALLPAAAELPDEAHRQLREAVRRRWARVVMIAITFLLISGLYNLITFEKASHDWGPEWHNGPSRLYHVLLGVKLLLALAIFFLASALVGRTPALARFRQDARFWVAVNLTLGILLVCVAGQMRMMHTGPPTAAQQQENATAPVSQAFQSEGNQTNFMSAKKG